MARFATRLLRFLAAAFIVVFALAVLGTLVPQTPVLSSLGPDLLARFGPWILILSLLGMVMSLRRWTRQHRRGALAMAALACFAAVGTAAVQLQQIRAARAQGIRIDLASLFSLGTGSGDTAPSLSFVYGSQDGMPLKLVVYRPAHAAGHALSPVLVYVHGGGWVGGSESQREADMRWFAARGYLVVSPGYSLSSSSRHFWNVVQPQLGCALAWVGGNAATYGGDLSRLALIGESAGGNLVINLSYMAARGELKPSCAGRLPHVAATVALYPVIDAARAYRNPDLTVGRFSRSMAIDYTGGSPDAFADRYAYVSSSTYISAAAPPTLLVVPEGDTLVAPEAAYAFSAQARDAGVDIRLIRVPYAQHGFDLTGGSIGNQLVRQATIHFLDGHLE